MDRIYKYNPDATYKPNQGRYLHLITAMDLYIQYVSVSEHDSFQVKFSNIFTNYPLGAVRVEDQRFIDWDHYKFTLWQIAIEFLGILCPGGYFQIRRLGMVGPHIIFGGKIWGMVCPSSPNKGKFGKFCHGKMQKLGKSHNFSVRSEIHRAKFGAFVTYIFGGKIWGSNKNFRGKFLGQDLDLLI